MAEFRGTYSAATPNIAGLVGLADDERAVLGYLLRHGEVSRSEVARAFNYSKPKAIP